jgi:hypothetical protein
VVAYPIIETLGEVFANIASGNGKKTPSDAFKTFE